MQTDHDPPIGGPDQPEPSQDEGSTGVAPSTEEEQHAEETETAAPESDAAAKEEETAEPTAEAEDEAEAPEAPKPDWEDLGLPEDRIAVLRKLGYEKPMEVQVATYEMLRDGRDIMVQSRTGSGKTAAFGIPLVAELLDQEDRSPYALALAPTRELAIQVADELGRIAEGTDVVVTALYGGAAIGPQIKKLEEGVQIVCGTPGRVLDHIRRRTLKVDGIRALVLDEADEMLSMGFYEELSAIISKLPNRDQTLLFSATIPDEVMRLANKYLEDPERLLLSEDFVGVKEISHVYYMVSGMARPRDLMRIFEHEDVESAIIFCNTREETAHLARYLRDAGLSAEPISSDFSQAERENTMQRMKEGKTRFLVATDIAARGIDIAALSHVFNYRFPENADIYIHRTGRTGRAGKSGVAISLVSPQELGDFYYMKLTHDITPEERFLPTAAELAAKLEGERFANLTRQIDELDEAVDPEYLSLARRIWQSLRGEEIMAHLLQEHFAKPVDQARPSRRRRPRREETDEPQRSERPDRYERERRPSRDRDRDRGRGPRRGDRRGGRGDDRGDRRRGERRSGRPEEREEGRKLYLNIGRNAGMKPSMLIQFLVSNAEIERKDVHRIQIRDNYSFINVADNVAEDVVAKANGKSLGDKEVSVELARAR